MFPVFPVLPVRVCACLHYTPSFYIYVCVFPLPLLRYIQATCATTGDGLYEGLDWLSNTLKKSKS